VTYPANGHSGGRVISVQGQGWFAWKQNIPYDPNALYMMTVRARQTSAGTAGANESFYAGVEGVAADGTTLINTAGANLSSSQHNFCASNFDLGAGAAIGNWQTFQGYVSGLGTPDGLAHADIDDPEVMYSSGGTVVKFIRPVFIANLTAGTGIVEVDYIRIVRVIANDTLGPDAATDTFVTDEPADGSQVYSATTQPAVEVSGIGGVASYTSPEIRRKSASATPRAASQSARQRLASR
jgi:hypothetical protein